MALKLPAGHTPRYENFEIAGVSDETIREGLERALFGATDERKLQLVEALSDAGIRDIDMGSGIQEPKFLLRCLDAQQYFGRIHPDTKFVFNLTLKSWEPISHILAKLPTDYLSQIQVSLGMVEFHEEEDLLTKVHGRLSEIGVGSFRSSILNAFSTHIEEERYEFISRQIRRVSELGIDLVRVNDSIGSLIPDATAILAANLTRDFPATNFYLHSHDDRGLGLANSLASIFNGFQIVEGGVAGFGNRAGLANLEVLSKIFEERGITVKGTPLDTQKLIKVASLAEETFLVAPSVYRPVSGILTEEENAGIVNVPDFLDIERSVRYFLNPVGLFPDTIEQILINAGFPQEQLTDPGFVQAIIDRLNDKLQNHLYPQKEAQYAKVMQAIHDLHSDVVRLDEVQSVAMELLQERVEVKA
ncbi:hypothetical protein [Glutamicibacter sp. Je.9.36]|uniref:hypothetical protein n=1 Tax=Glutamicibacter sp. Je.9.36 TaxID=3142837 RepID=UPI003DA8D5DC